VITGESLYGFKGNYEFVNDFKKRADTYDANLGLVYAENDPEHKGEHLDQELLICDIANDGEPSAFGRYGMSVAMLSGLLRAQTLFEEYRKDGKLFLRFKNTEMALMFAGRRQMLIDGYATLLSFETAFKKLSPIYETDMTDYASQRLAALREHIEQHNKAVRIATNTDEESKKLRNTFLLEKEIMPFEEDLTIDINAIDSDQKILAEQEAKLREFFPNL
jgi:hypothetical protein